MSGAGMMAIGIGFLMTFKAFGLVNIDNAGRKLKQLGKDGEEAAKAIASLKVAAMTGAGLVAFGTSIAYGLSKALKTSVEFNYEFTKLQTLFRDLRSVDLPSLEKSITRTAKLTGEDLVEATRSMFAIVTSGIQDQVQAQHLLEKSSMAAVAGYSSTSVAVDAATSVLNTFGLQAKYAADEIDGNLAEAIKKATGLTVEIGQEFDLVSDLFDVFFVSIREGKTTFEELAGGIGKLLPISRSLGLSYRDLLGSAATLTRFGLDTGEALTGLRSIFISVVKQTERTKDASKGLGIQFDINAIKTEGFVNYINKLGESLEDFAGPDGMERIKKALETGQITVGDITFDLNKTEMGRFTEIMERMKAGTYDAAEMVYWLMGRVQGANAAMGLLNDGGKLNTEVSEQMLNSHGAMAEKFEMMSKTYEKTKDRISAVWETIKKSAGDTVEKVLLGPMLLMEGFLNKISMWMEENPEMVAIITKIAMAVAGASIAVGSLMIAFSALTAVIIAIKFAGAAALILAGKFLLIGIAIVAAVAAIGYVVMSEWDEIVNYLKESGWIDAIVNTWTWLKEFFSGMWEGMKQPFIGVWGAIKEAIKDLFTMFKSIGNMFVNIWETVFGKSTLEGGRKIGEIIGKIVGYILLIPFAFIIGWLKIFGQLIEWSARVIGAVVTVTLYAIKLIIELAKKLPDVFAWMVDKSGEKLTQLLDWIIITYRKVVAWLKSAWESTSDFVSNLLSNTWNAIKKFFSMEGQMSLARSVLKIIDYLLDNLRDFSIDLKVIDPIFPFKSIPRLAEYAEGGLVTQPTIAKIAEDGPELLIPLRKLELEGRKDSRGLKFDNMRNLGSVNVGSPNVDVRPIIKVDGKDIITATDRRNVLTAMSAGRGLHYSWHGVA